MRINIPGLENINIDEVLGREPKPKRKKAIDRRINLTPKQKSKITAKPKRLSIPSGEIDISEIGSILPTSRPRPRPRPKPSGSVPSEAEMSKKLKEFSEQIKSRPTSGTPPVLGSIPGMGETGMINIPGVGSIQLPQAVKPPASIAPEFLDKNWWINEGPKTLPGSRPEIQIPSDPFAGYRDREDDDEEDTPPADFQSPSEYLSEQEMENITTPNPSLTEEQLRQLYTSGMMNFDDDYFTDTEGMFGEAGQRYGLGVPQDRIDEIAQEINFSSNQSEPAPAPTPAPTPPSKPAVNPFKDYVPRNILGQSFDPRDLSAHKKMVQDARNRQNPGANIQGGGYLTYDNPILGNKQTQFGGYGQPMPTKPLMNYAGLASPVTYSTPDPDPDKEIIR